MSISEWSFSAEKSRSLFERALNVIPQGCLSDPQGPAIYQPHPIYIERGEGPRIYDVDGNEFLDFFMGAGPLILGHANPAINKAIRERHTSLSAVGLANASLADANTTRA